MRWLPRTSWGLAGLWAFTGLLMSAPAFAQGARGAPPTEDTRAAGFRAMEGANVEDVPGGMLLVAAYGIAWVLVLGFVWRMAGLQRRAAADLARVEAALAERPEEP